MHTKVAKGSAKRIEVFRKLCKAMLSSSSNFGLVSILRGGGLRLKPSSRGTLTTIDLDFGGAFCIALIERSRVDIPQPATLNRPDCPDVITRNVTRWLQAP